MLKYQLFEFYLIEVYSALKDKAAQLENYSTSNSFILSELGEEPAYKTLGEYSYLLELALKVSPLKRQLSFGSCRPSSLGI